MATWDQVRRYALALPGVSESTSRDKRVWIVDKRFFVWERPLGKKDRADLGDAAPSGEILGIRTADLDMKEALLASLPDVAFTIPHFEGYSAILIRLDAISAKQLKELVVEAWISRASDRIVRRYLAENKRS